MTDGNLRLKSLKEAMEDISSAGEAARLQLHLLSMQARQRTGELEVSIETLEERLDRGIEQAMQVASAKTKQLTKTLQEFLGRQSQKPGDGEVLVRAIMTEGVRSCSPSDSLVQAAQIMWDTDCGAVAVTNADGRLCGIITDRDICMAAYLRGLPLSSILVQEVMTREVHTASDTDTLERAASLMGSAQVRRLPVTSSEGHVVGIVSLADIARNAGILGARAAEHLTYHLLREVSKRRNEPMQSARQAAE